MTSVGSDPYDMDDLHWVWVDNLGVWAPTPALLIAESEGRPTQPQPCECARIYALCRVDGTVIKRGIGAESTCWGCDGTGIRGGGSPCEAEWAVTHPPDCSCAIPCRTCGHESEQHAGSLFGGTGPRRCMVPGCTCKGAFIGSIPARCKQAATLATTSQDRLTEEQ